jgi:transcriptional regulator with XRE-family HTH domain
MPRKTLASLGALVKAKRGERKLREVAKEVGIGPATLMRVENGRIPDVTTFAKICRWLDVDPGEFLGFERKGVTPGPRGTDSSAVLISAHLRADQTPTQDTVQALARMILLAAKRQPRIEGVPGDAIA